MAFYTQILSNLLEVPPQIRGKAWLQTQEDEPQAAYSGPQTALLLWEKKEMERAKGNFKNIRRTHIFGNKKNLEKKEKWEGPWRTNEWGSQEAGKERERSW